MILIVILAMAGLAVGPLLGIIVDRAVERTPLAPEHRCTSCGTGLGSSSLLPVVGWRDHCPSCHEHKGLRYPLVDIGAALIFPLLGLRFGSGWMLWPYLGLGAVLIVLSAIDFETHLLPNIIVWPTFFASLFCILVVSGQLDYPDGIASALVGGAVFAGFIGGAHLAYAHGMGRGDVKLSLILGLFIGWLQPSLVDATRMVLLTILLALAGGGLIGLAYNTARKRGRAEIPFGPALAAATLAMVVISSSVTETVSF